MKSTKKSFVFSLLSVLLCVSMLIGTTFAWFTDTAKSSNNRIVAGNLDVEMYWSESYDGPWHNVEDPAYSVVFGQEKWEPGYTEMRYFKIVNAGKLALKYQLGIEAAGVIGALADVIDVYYFDDAVEINERTELLTHTPIGVLSNVIYGLSSGMVNSPEGTLLPAGSDEDLGVPVGQTFCAIALHMQESAGNEYKNASIGEGFYITLKATQASFESDSFGSEYDDDVSFPQINLPVLATASVATDDSGFTTEQTSINENGEINALVQAGTKLESGTDSVMLAVTLVSQNGNVEATDGTISRTLDVHVSGVAEGNTVPVIVTINNALPINMELDAVALYHKENGVQNQMIQKTSAAAVSGHNEYYYNSTDGSVVMALASFSEILFEANTENIWEGTVEENPYSSGEGSAENPYIVSTVGQLAKLAENVNNGISYKEVYFKLDRNLVINNWDDVTNYQLSEYNKNTKAGEGNENITAKGLSKYNDPAFEQQHKEDEDGKTYLTWTPIGDGNHAFSGHFDGNGHTISGLFKLHYDDPMDRNPMGLFGWIHDGSVKNLTVADSFIYTYGGTVGLVSAYASGETTFENISVKDNFVTSYNYPLGGILGMAWQANEDKKSSTIDDRITFKNVTIDSSNLLEALWGTYDSAVGGIVGTAYPDTDITFETVTSWPELSLYNDCCANYQWFAYRYSGMLIGHVRASDRATWLANNVHCTDVVVKYGSWTDQFYCEFESAGKPSYAQPGEWKYRRISESELRKENGVVTGCTHEHTDEEDHNAVNLRFNQLFGGGQGVYGEDNDKYLTYCKQYGKDSTGVTIEDNGESGANLSTKFKNNDKYLYRIGNKNSVTIGTIFSADGITDDESVQLLTETVSGTASVTYTPNSSNWENGTLKFSGTGLIKLMFKYLGSTPVELYLEVIDANNISAMTNISTADAVLVKDCSMGETTYTVSNGHTLYGNGFTISSMNVGLGLNADLMGNGYIKLDSGNLENVRVVCAIYPRGYLYHNPKSYGEAVKDANNKNPLRSESGKDRYNYQYSAVVVDGKSSISNCYIEGARNNILVSPGASGSVVYNTTLAYGSLANMHVQASSGTITLKDLTTIQDVVSTNLPSTLLADGNHNNDSSKTVFGLGILVGDDETSSYPTIKIEGTLKQNNWIKQGTTVSSSISNMIINAVFNGNSDYQKTINGQKYVNIGIVYMSTKSANIDDDDMTNKADYKLGNVSIANIGTGQTYSYIGSADSSSLAIPDYDYSANEKDGRRDAVKLRYLGSNNYTVSEEYDSASNCLIPTIRTEIGEGESAKIAVNDIVALRSGKTYNPDSVTVNGEAVSSNYEINCNKSDQFTIRLSGNTAGYYNKDGVFIDDVRSFDLAFKFLVVSTAIDPPELFFNSNYDTYTNKFKTGSGDWSGAWKALNDVEVRYFSLSRNCYVQVPLNVFTPASNSKLDKTWSGTYDGCTLTITSTTVIKSPDYGYFIVDKGEMYLTCDTKVSNKTSNREATIEYRFEDGNSKSATVSKKRTIERANAQTYSPSTSTKQYYLRLDPGAGTVSTNAYGPYSSNVDVTLPTPTLEGYAFDGWFDQPVGGNRKSTSYKTTASNVVLFAHWHELIKRTVSFEVGGGYCDETAHEGYSGSTSNLPTPTRDGFWLEGWYTEETGGTKIGNAGASFTVPDTDTTYYAHWSPIYTVTYNMTNGGTVSPTSATYEGTALTLPTPTPGSQPTFEGWYTAASGGTRIGGAGGSYTPTANITLYAQWSNNILVTFNGNGGTAGTNSATYDHVTPITLPTATWTGHQFNGWYTASSGGTKVGNAGASYTPTSQTTLYAQWTAYTVTYNANSGSVSPASASAGSDGSVTLPTPTRTGYTFNGWYTAASGGTKIGNAGASYTPTADITLHAQWIVNSYKVTITTSNSSTAVMVNGTTVNSGGSVAYNSVVKVVLSYTQSDSLTFTIKQGNTNVTRYSNEACTTTTTSTAAGTYYFKMPAGDVTINSSSSKPSSCVTPDTLVTLADGTHKPISEVKSGDMLLAWDFYSGKTVAAPVVFNDGEPEAMCDVITAIFSDGTEVGVIYEHGFFDIDLGKFVYFDHNAEQYIGHAFVKQAGEETQIVTLTDVIIEQKMTTAFDTNTYEHLCFYTNDMLSISGGIEGLFNIFDVDTETMTYNAEKMQNDIATYGLLTLDDYNGMITEDMFYAFNGQYLGIAVGKGLITWDYIQYLAERYAPLCE